MFFRETTANIRVSVEPQYLNEQSNPTDRQFAWAYTIAIENLGTESVQILGRRWRIVDTNGLIQEVEGPGVVGEKPVIGAGERFEYTSVANLVTSSGIMYGSYDARKLEGERFRVTIPPFSLDSPEQISLPN